MMGIFDSGIGGLTVCTASRRPRAWGDTILKINQ